MKPREVKQKALELYIHSVPIYRIAKQLKINKTTFYKWQKKGKWDQLKENAIQKANEKATEDMIEGQKTIALCATKILAGRLLNEEGKVKTPELVSIMKHGLEVVRPKQTTNNLNITKNDQAIQIIIPKEVEALLRQEKEVLLND